MCLKEDVGMWLRLKGPALMTRRIKWLVGASLLIGSYGPAARGQTINANTCGAVDVQTAINSATVGTTVNVPAGSCSWVGSTITLAKAITLQGAGQASLGTSCPLSGGQTNITLGGNQSVIITKQTGVVRIQKFNFDTGAGGSPVYPIVIQGSWQGTQPVIVNNNSFCTTGNVTNIFDIFVPGGAIFSNNIFVDTGFNGCCFSIKVGNSSQSWTTADSLGMHDTSGLLNHYIEGNTFYGASNGVTDCDDGCRMVVRHNTFSFGGLNSHGQDTSPQGMREWEIYNNQFLYPNSSSTLANVQQYIWIRGATGVIFGNSFQHISGQTWGTKPEIKMSIRGAEDVRPQGSCAQVSYPVPHQLGQNNNGSSDFTDPVYLWSNTMGSGAPVLATGWNWGNPCGLNFNNFFQSPRDYVDNGSAGGAKPGYTPYTYPHPLAAGSGTPPAPPTNLQGIVI